MSVEVAVWAATFTLRTPALSGRGAVGLGGNPLVKKSQISVKIN